MQVRGKTIYIGSNNYAKPYKTDILREIKYGRNIISSFNSDNLYRYNVILSRYSLYNYIIAMHIYSLAEKMNNNQ